MAKSSIEIRLAPLLVDEQLVASNPVDTGTRAGLQHRARTDVGPLHRPVVSLVDRQRVGLGQRLGLPLVVEVGRVHQPLPRGHEQAAGAAGHHQAIDADALPARSAAHARRPLRASPAVRAG